MENFLNIFKPPTFDDGQKNRRAEFLHYTSVLVCTANLTIFLIVVVFGEQATKSVIWTIGAASLLQILIQYLMRKSHVNFTSRIELAYSWLAITQILRYTSSIQQSTPGLYPHPARIRLSIRMASCDCVHSCKHCIDVVAGIPGATADPGNPYK